MAAPRPGVERALRCAVCWCVALAWASLGPGALAQGRPPAEPAAQAQPRTAQSLLKAAQDDLQAGRVDAALAGLREAVALAPDDADLRLRLAQWLMDRGRPVAASPEIRHVLAIRPDAAAHEARLRLLAMLDAQAERAIAAEEAVQRFPGHEPFLWAAAESLAATAEHGRALAYWRRLPPPAQATVRGQHLLGTLHEGLGQPAQALAAYRAARDDPRALQAAQRLMARALRLDGRLYFPPAGWLALPGDPPRLLMAQDGASATLAWRPGSTALPALRDVAGRRMPLPPDFPLEPRPGTARGAAPDPAGPPAPVDVSAVACAGDPPVRCLQLAPPQALATLLPTLFVAVREQPGGSLVVILEGVPPAAAARLLQALAGTETLPEATTP